MGYTTDFYGQININKPLDPELREFLIRLSKSRRMKRDPEKLSKRLGISLEECLKVFGEEGEFYAEPGNCLGQLHDEDVVNFNSPPSTQPSLWLRWIPNEDGTAIIWDGGEKFYSSPEWMKYIIDKILAPKGYVLNGHILAQGEGMGDVWTLVVKNNVVTTQRGHARPIE